MLEARSDVVGSLLRPPELLDARRRYERGELPEPDFRRIEDAAVDEVIQRQEDCGLEVLTDGELRRFSFQSQMVEAVEGFGDWDLDAFLWGEWRSDELGTVRIERPAIGAVDKLRRRRFLSAAEFAYARRRTDRTVKVTLPSPTLFAQFWDPDRSRSAYPTLESFIDDVAAILREEVEELVRLGATYIQIDAPQYPLLADPGYRSFYEHHGWPAGDPLAFALAYDRALMSALPTDVTLGFHLCRGNQMSRWLVAGGYDWLAERVFGRVAAHRFLLEYDDERSGTFEPLGSVPEDRVVVLGLVTTKSGRRETVDELTRRIEEASAFVPLERLALSTQCGFASSIEGNALTPDRQWAKLRTIVETAAKVWG